MASLRSLGQRGFTLVEMMIAMIITLLIVFAMVEAFRWVGDSTTEGRAVIEMLGQIRHARVQLEDDLAHRTVRRLVPRGINMETAPGYFQLLEGIGSDNRFDTTAPAVPLPVRFINRTNATGYTTTTFNDPLNTAAAAHGSMFSDVDDVLHFTVRNDAQPYRGRYQGLQIESSLAEIIWWSELNDRATDTNGDGTINLDPDGDGYVNYDANGNGVLNGAELVEGMNGTWDAGETFTIRRRVLLIRPDLNNANGLIAGLADPGDVDEFLRDNDISVRTFIDQDGVAQTAANSLNELTFRHNRTAHAPIDTTIVDGNAVPVQRGLSAGGFMSPLQVNRIPTYHDPDLYGEDVVLSNVIGFDFRVWDPQAPVCDYATGELSEGLVPGDAGFNAAIQRAGGIVGRGAYVDLGALALNPPTPAQVQTNAAPAQFLFAMDARSYLPVGSSYVYDPWSLNPERDGYNQDGDAAVDEGTNGLDDDGQNGPDDLGSYVNLDGECETAPPYGYPLDSIQVKIRMYEPDTRQVRQVSQTIRFND